jgi:hypothetical protein
VTETGVERLRARYRPRQIRLLLVGESAPAGGTFFYAENSTLYFETREAFARQFPDDLAGRSFLEVFRRLGCYLDDLCLEPVNHLPPVPRRQKRAEAEASLSTRLREYDPRMVVAIGKTTAAPHVQAALDRAEMTNLDFAVVAFPGRPAHKVDFHAAMSTVLASARGAGVLETSPGDSSNAE